MPPRPRILLIDDEETFLYATAELLRQEGYRCDTATDSDQAVEQLSKYRYDVLLSDIRMPGNENLQFLRQLEDLARDTPVILISGYPSAETDLNSCRFSVSAYIVKPSEFEEILKAVEKALGAKIASHADGSL